jgi:hypothetical protein
LGFGKKLTKLQHQETLAFAKKKKNVLDTFVHLSWKKKNRTTGIGCETIQQLFRLVQKVGQSVNIAAVMTWAYLALALCKGILARK